MRTHCVLCEVSTGLLNIIYINFRLQQNSAIRFGVMLVTADLETNCTR